MTQAISTQTNSMGIVNYASGSVVTDAVTAAAATFTLGFTPRKVIFTNLTDCIVDTWFDGMTENDLYVNLVGMLGHLDADSGVTDTNYGALCTPSAITTGTGGPTSTPPYDVAPEDANNLDRIRAGFIAALNKLDADAGVTDTNYTALWTPGASTVVSITAAMTGALAKLDADGGVNSTDYAATYTPTNTISLHSVAAGDKTYEKTNGIAVVDNTFSVTATTLVASKQFYWEAIG